MTDPISNEPVVRWLMLIAEGTVFLIALLLALGLLKAFRIWRETRKYEHKFQVMHAAIEKMRAHESRAETWDDVRRRYKEFDEETQ